ncbi:MAG: T9SS C-terminal target domain-containing protein [Balneolaceae bacterium]|nr:MAG: T9SS C-terminal target domain-containing protein [Balneolaceae bacterium]
MIYSAYKFRILRFFVLLCVFQLFSEATVAIISQEITVPVSFSKTGGFYTEEFILELSHPHPDARIYYTLDGSVPDPGNLDGTTYLHMDRYRSDQQVMLEKSYTTHRYDGKSPIMIRNRSVEENYFSRMQTAIEIQSVPYYFPREPVFKGTVVRAIAIVNDQVSPAVTHTYLVTEEGRGRFTLPVIAITVQEDELFDYHNGIYVPGFLYDQNNPFSTRGDARANYTQRGIEWERRVTLELFESGSSNPDLKQDAGIRIHGGWSRTIPMKSLRLYARSEYGENRFRYQMFPDQPYTVFNRLILRNGGNDWSEAMMRDPLLQGIVKHMNIDTQAYRPFIVLLNGEYWGIHNMRERYDKHYLARKYGVDPDNIDLLNNKAVASEGNNHHYMETLSYIREYGLEEDIHYEFIKTRIDVENYIDHQIAHIFVANADWPGNNIDFWRLRTNEFQPEAHYGQDGRWRWLTVDMDFGFHLYDGCNEVNHLCSTPDHNTLAFAARTDGPVWPNPPWATELFRALLENETFRTHFITRYLDQLNTAFLTERLESEVMRVSDNIKQEMKEHLDRWFASHSWHNMNRWENLIRSRLLPFAEQRNEYARMHLKEFFNIQNEHILTVDVSDPAAGFVQVNTIFLSPETPGISTNPWPWQGSYFEEIPVVLVAHPLPGYRFSHWVGEGRRYHHPVLQRNLTGAESLKAVFYPDQEAVMFPVAHSLRKEPYHLNEWPSNKITEWPGDKPESGYPEHMVFVYMNNEDPQLNANIAGFTEGLYNLDTRTRINGLGEGGFAFINTSNGNMGYPDTKLGGAILAINTRRIRNIRVQWDGSTIRPNSRVYNLRLQYRIGNEGPFKDVMDEHGRPVEYKRNEKEGHSEQMGPVYLPEDAEDKGYIQLLWRYYHTGIQLDEDSGQRSKMAVSNILVEGLDILGEDFDLIYPPNHKVFQNYPNPFNSVTIIGYELNEAAEVRIDIYDMLGRRIETLLNEFRQAGGHYVRWEASGRASGIYICRLQIGNQVITQTMTLVK